MAEYKVSFVAVVGEEMTPDLVQRAVVAGLQQSALLQLLHVERVVVGPPWNKHRPQLHRGDSGVLEWSVVERPEEGPESANNA